MNFGLVSTDLISGSEFNDGGVVIDWFNCDSDIGWFAPAHTIKDPEHNPGSGVCVCECVCVCVSVCACV